MDCPGSEPIDPRVKRTRKLLQDALRSLMREKHFSAISVQDIAERATVNRATFYAHYTDKEDLAVNIIKEDFHTALMQRFSERLTLTNEKLVELAIVVFEFVGNMQDACPSTTTELEGKIGPTVQQELYHTMERLLSENGAAMRLFPGSSKETVATVLSWSIYGGAQRWSRSKRRAPATRECQEIVSILLPNQVR